MNYPGSKNGSGVYQKIISLMPPHKTYIELFLGSGAILRRKKRASMNIGVDLDNSLLNESLFNALLYAMDALDFLETQFHYIENNTLVYADPPYLRSVRSSKNRIYKHEFWTEEDHTKLLELLKSLDCMVMVSGYKSELYAELLSDWRTFDIPTINRAGKRVTETVWMNFAEPRELHDYSFLGKDKIDRQRIKRKAAGWINKLKNLPVQERYAIMHEIENFKKQS